MIIDDFDLLKIIFSFDRKANPILVIDTNAVLSLPVSVQGFQMICGWNFQILHTSCIVNHDQFSQCHSLNILRELPGENLIVDFLRLLVGEVLYHMATLYPLYVYMSNGYNAGSEKREFYKGEFEVVEKERYYARIAGREGKCDPAVQLLKVQRQRLLIICARTPFLFFRTRE